MKKEVIIGLTILCILILTSAKIIESVVKHDAETRYVVYPGLSYKDAVTECRYDVLNRNEKECIEELTRDIIREVK